jgi:hypothetical protein
MHGSKHHASNAFSSESNAYGLIGGYKLRENSLHYRKHNVYFIMDDALDAMLAHPRYAAFQFDYAPGVVHRKAYKLAELGVYRQADENRKARYRGGGHSGTHCIALKSNLSPALPATATIAHRHSKPEPQPATRHCQHLEWPRKVASPRHQQQDTTVQQRVWSLLMRHAWQQREVSRWMVLATMSRGM